MNIPHKWAAPVRFAGSIAFGPPPGARHHQAVVYICEVCDAQHVEPITDTKALTMHDGLPDVVAVGLDKDRLWDGHGPCLGKKVPMSTNTITDYCKQIHDWAIEKGWYKHGQFADRENPVEVAAKLALIHSEVSEALEAVRDGQFDMHNGFALNKPDGAIVELADVVIRCCNLAAGMQADGLITTSLQEAIEAKLAYNQKRPYKHGGRKI